MNDVDMSRTIAPKSDQLNADDLIAGPITIIVREVSGSSEPQQPVNVHYEGDNGKPYKPCKSMRRIMVRAWGDQAREYVGRSMTLYNDPSVKFGGMAVGGIRISHMSHIDTDMTVALTTSKAQRKPYTVKCLQVQKAPDVDPSAEIEALNMARTAATSGTHFFTKWYNSDEGKGVRGKFPDALKSELPKLQADCAKADETLAATGDDVFGKGGENGNG